MKFKFKQINWWGNEIYVNDKNLPIVKLEEGFYTLADFSDIDSDPCSKLKDELIEIVDEF